MSDTRDIDYARCKLQQQFFPLRRELIVRKMQELDGYTGRRIVPSTPEAREAARRDMDESAQDIRTHNEECGKRWSDTIIL